MTRVLQTRSGPLALPAFLPVTTIGSRFPLDDLVRPYLPRLSAGLMVSYHYAKQMTRRPDGILFIDSGGFASLFEGSDYIERGDYTVIRTREGDEIAPPDVLTLQEKHADIGATVDFLIPPDCPREEAERRQLLTERNARWALAHRRRSDLRLFASVQAWDADSATATMNTLVSHPFDGFALGGMVPRIKRPEEIIEIVRAIRAADRERPLHVFGIGNAALIRTLFSEGVSSVDSSSYVRAAADGKYLYAETGTMRDVAEVTDARCPCPPCRKLGTTYLSLESEANRMALALHNLHALKAATAHTIGGDSVYGASAATKSSSSS
jgi:tRNA-guanine family transglycosylase